MGPLSSLEQHLGLVTLTAIAAVLTLYLLYAMIRPEKF
jgi:K+-transporting ATPase KdpF subunit